MMNNQQINVLEKPVFAKKIAVQEARNTVDYVFKSNDQKTSTMIPLVFASNRQLEAQIAHYGSSKNKKTSVPPTPSSRKTNKSKKPVKRPEKQMIHEFTDSDGNIIS